MERDEARVELKKLERQDLRPLAKQLQITIHDEVTGKLNKGWAGHTIQRYLGLPLDSAQSPNFGSWELKTTKIKFVKGVWQYKETLAITMIDPFNVKVTDFQDSFLYAKLRKFLLVVLIAQPKGKDAETPLYVAKASEVNLSPEVLKIVENDYNLIRDCISDPNRGFNSLTGRMGVFIQPRTKGAGHGSTSRAFYGRKEFLNTVVTLDDIMAPNEP